MIIKVHDDLAKAFLEASTEGPHEDISRLTPLLPDWLKEMLGRGRFLVVDKEDYLGIPADLLPYIEVIHHS